MKIAIPLLAFLSAVSFSAENTAPPQSRDYRAGYSSGYAMGIKGAQTSVPHSDPINPEYVRGYLSGQFDGLRKFTADTMGDDFIELLRSGDSKDLREIRIDSKHGIRVFVQITYSDQPTVAVAALGKGAFDIRFDLEIDGRRINQRSIALSSVLGLAVGTVQLTAPMNLNRIRSESSLRDLATADVRDLSAVNVRSTPK